MRHRQSTFGAGEGNRAFRRIPANPRDDEDVGDIWLAEAERRLKAYDEGTVNAPEIEDALSEIERQLK